MGVELFGGQHPAIAVRNLGHEVPDLGFDRRAQRWSRSVVEEHVGALWISRKLGSQSQLAGGVGAVADPPVANS
jgi:hypothetical protein